MIKNNETNLLNSFFNILNKVVGIIIGLLLLFITILITFNVIGRYIFGNTLSWAEEMTRYVIIWLTFIGSIVCVHNNSHVGVDILLNKITPEKRWILESVIAFIGFIFSIILTYYGWTLFRKIYFSNQLSTAMMIPMYLVYMAVPIGGFFMSLQYLKRMLDTILAKK